ncbi:hypothetical protein [Mycobacterium intracellulare]|uniref:hypothetical protein n=1 Tax=Mycobacterium intracellulare TaxID=1767 RepID=UPI0014450839|nr:hypothetical protein [Mycobacterium intracellulare]
MTPSEWLQANLSDVIVAVARAGATLAGSPAEAAATQANTHLQANAQPQKEVSQDE